MDHEITHRRRLPPRQSRMGALECIRDLRRGLPYDFKKTFKRELLFFRSIIIRARDIREADYLPAGVDHVLDTVVITVSVAHIKTLSARTRVPNESRLSAFSVIISTGRLKSDCNSSCNPDSPNRVAPGAKSTMRSMSLSGVSSFLAQEPKTYTDRPLYLQVSRCTSSRLARIVSNMHIAE